MKQKRLTPYKPRTIDRVVFGILAVAFVTGAAYLIGPWYLTVTEGARTPLYAMINNHNIIILYGVLLFIDGLVLLYASVSDGNTRRYTHIVTNGLLVGFLLRLYSLIGVFLTLDSWKPPSYISQTAIVLITGSYWLWVRVNARTAQ